jgi:methyl-accepting chemotaxis protein
MVALGGLAMMLFEDNMAGMQHDMHLQTIFLGIIAIVLLVSIVMVGVGGLIGLRLIRKAEDMAEKMENKIVPLADKTCDLVTQLGPRIHSLTENVEQISFTVRGKVDELSETVSELNRTVQEVNFRTRSQVQRVDGMVTDVLSTAQEVSRTVQDGIRKPVHQIAGIVAGLRVGLQTLIDRSPFLRRTPKQPNPYDM